MLLDYYTLFDILTAERVVGFFFFFKSGNLCSLKIIKFLIFFMLINHVTIKTRGRAIQAASLLRK